MSERNKRNQGKREKSKLLVGFVVRESYGPDVSDSSAKFSAEAENFVEA